MFVSNSHQFIVRILSNLYSNLIYTQITGVSNSNVFTGHIVKICGLEDHWKTHLVSSGINEIKSDLFWDICSIWKSLRATEIIMAGCMPIWDPALDHIFSQNQIILVFDWLKFHYQNRIWWSDLTEFEI